MTFTDEEEVALFVLDVLPSPLHVVGDVEEDHVLVVLSEVLHGVLEVLLGKRILQTKFVLHVW